MIRNESKLHAADNMGAKEVLIIRRSGGSVRKFLSIGDIVVRAVRQATSSGTIKEGDVAKGVIVRIRRGVCHDNGTYTKFDDNVTALIRDDNTPRGIRIFGLVARELRDKDFMKTVSLASEIL